MGISKGQVYKSFTGTCTIIDASDGDVVCYITNDNPHRYYDDYDNFQAHILKYNYVLQNTPASVASISVGQVYEEANGDAHVIVAIDNDGIFIASCGDSYKVSLEDMKGAISSNRITLRNTNALGCVHDWKQYIGFTEAYHYCTQCNIKQVEATRGRVDT